MRPALFDGEEGELALDAADFDLDGDVDVYVCGYNPTASTLRRGAMGEPMPYHDANNGGQNILDIFSGQPG